MSFRQIITAALFVVILCVHIRCACDCTPPAPSMNIKELVASDGYKQSPSVSAEKALDTLAYYLNLYPELVAFMEGSSEYTLFAPSNAAFARLRSTPGFPPAAGVNQVIKSELLRWVLTFHFVEGKRKKADLTAGTVLTSMFINPLFTVGPETLTVNQDGTLKGSPMASNTAVDIVVADILATNGVVHVIESVLVPPHLLPEFFPFGSVLSIVLLNSEFSNITKVIMAADEAFRENHETFQYKVSTLLAMPINQAFVSTPNLKGITFFAPLNSVITTSIIDGLIASPDKGRSFLLNHVVVSLPGGAQAIGQYMVADPPANNPNTITKLEDLQEITPHSGAGKRILVRVSPSTVTDPNGVAVSNKGTPTSADFRPIISKDIRGTNGVLHAIGGTLD